MIQPRDYNHINWLFNLPNAKLALRALGSHNIRKIQAVVLEHPGEERVVAERFPIDEYNTQIKADDLKKELKRWINKVSADEPQYYVYFRIIK